MEESKKSLNILKDLVSFVSAKYVSFFFSGIQSLALAKFMGPADFGTWNIFTLALRYADQSHLGLRHALNKEAPIVRGRDEEDLFWQMQGTALVWITLFALLAAAVVAVVALNLETSTLVLVSGLLITAAIIPAAQIQSLLITVARINADFGMVGLLNILTGGASLVLVLGLWWLYGVVGAVAGLGLSYVSVIAFFAVKRGNVLRTLFAHASFNRKVFKKLMAIGIPLMLLGYGTVFMMTVDRLLILRFMDKTQFGLYSLGKIVGGMSKTLATYIGVVLITHFGLKLGQKDMAGLKRYYDKSVFFLANAYPLFLGLITICLPVMVKYFLPRYAPVIPVAIVLIQGAFFNALVSVTDQLLVVFGRYRGMGVCFCLAIAVGGGLGFLAIRLGGGLLWVAAATAASYWTYSTSAFYVASRALELPGRKILAEYLRQCWPFAYGLVMLAATQWIVDFMAVDGTLLEDAAQTAKGVGLFVLFYIPVLYNLNRRIQLLGKIKAVMGR